MLKKSPVFKSMFFFINLIVFNSILASDFYSSGFDLDSFHIYEEIIPEHETIMYQTQGLQDIEMVKKGKKKKPKPNAPVVQQAPQVNISQLVKNGVNTSYNAYKIDCEQSVAREYQRLASMNALNSSYANQVINACAKSFAEKIINQISCLTQPLSPNNRQVFWNLANVEVKRVLSEFCGKYQVPTDGLNSHIDNLINVKKTFG